MTLIHTEAGEKTPQRDLIMTLIHTESGDKNLTATLRTGRHAEDAWS